MKLFKPAFDGFFKANKIKLYIISIAITLGFVISFVYNLYLLNNIYADKIKNNILNRILYVSRNDISELDIKNLNEIENIEEVYRELNIFSMTMDENKNVNIKYGSKLEIPKLILGKGFEDDKEMQIILPSKFLTQENKYISLESYYGKKVKLRLEDYEVEVYVTGIYDDINSNYVYINKNLKDDLVRYNREIETSTILSVIVDDYKNIEHVIENLKNNYSYNANIREMSGQSDIKMYNLASLLIIVIVILVTIFMYISIGIIIDGIISDERKDIAILKAIGYKKKHLNKIMSYRIFTVLTISFIIGILLSMFLNILIGKIIQTRLDINILQNYKAYFIITILLVILIYLVSTITIKLNNKKIKRVNAIELLKDS